MSESWRETALVACRLLGDAVNGRAVDTLTLPDEKALLGFASVHRLVTLVSGALRTLGIADERYPALHTAAEKAAFGQIKNDLITSSALEQLTAQGIRVLPLKGAAIQAVYPSGWIRTSTDVDWLVSNEQLAGACETLTALGFEQSGAHDGDVCFQKPPRTVVELHTALGGHTARQRAVLERLSATAFSVEEHYVYTLFHLYKHFVYAGAGVRLFWDMACLSRAVTDRARVAQWLEELELTAFDRAVQTVCGVLFDGEPCPESMRDVIDFVLLCGTFGTSESYHAMKKAAQPLVKKNRVRAWLEDYRFDIGSMAERYPRLERHRWLYPIYAVKRIVNGAVRKREVLQHVAKAEHAVDPRRVDAILRAMNLL